MLWVAGFFLIVQDALNKLLQIQGPFTVLIAGGLAVAVLGVVVMTRSLRHLQLVPVAMWLFIAWSATLFVLSPSTDGAQHVLVWSIFPISIASAASAGPGVSERVYRMWRVLAVMASLIYLGQVALDGPGADDRLYTNRGAGWLGLMAPVALAPRIVVRRERVWPLIPISAAVLLSLSRTPIAIALVVLAVLASLRAKNGAAPGLPRIAGRLVAYLGASTAIGWIVLTRYQPLRERFIGGDNAIVGGVSINTSGRTVLWSETLHRWSENPVFGNGTGDSQSYISAIYNGVIAHPHNEYLRILNDTGMIGLALWSAGMVALAARLVRTSRQNRGSGAWEPAAGLVAVLTFLIGSITDNLTITISVVVIAGSVIGLALAPARESHPEVGSRDFRARHRLPSGSSVRLGSAYRANVRQPIVRVARRSAVGTAGSAEPPSASGHR